MYSLIIFLTGRNMRKMVHSTFAKYLHDFVEGCYVNGSPNCRRELT